MTADLFARLHHYYDQKEIGAERFNCHHVEECRGTCTTFSTAKEAYVGDRYGADGLPRLVFLSLDSGDGGEQWHSSVGEAARARTLEALQAHENGLDIVAWAASHPRYRSHHWYQTHELALALLGGLRGALEIGSIHRYFAHTNSAKCSLNKKGRSEADRRLFQNCRAYIPSELRILAPDILVTQGQWAKVAVIRGVPEALEPMTSANGVAAETGSYRMISLPDRKIIWFHTYHPRFGGYWRQKQRDWPRWTEVVRARFGNIPEPKLTGGHDGHA